MRRTPSREITLLEDWKVKVKLMAKKVAEEDVRILGSSAKLDASGMQRSYED